MQLVYYYFCTGIELLWLGDPFLVWFDTFWHFDRSFAFLWAFRGCSTAAICIAQILTNIKEIVSIMRRFWDPLQIASYRNKLHLELPVELPFS